jgi:nucleoside phosphorylase
MIRIVLLFALPQEYGAFKQLVGPWGLLTREPFKSLVHRVPGKELLLVETGMGHDRMTEALGWILGKVRPDLVVASGFAGSLTQDLVVGDACLGEVFASLDLRSHSEIAPRIVQEIPIRLVQFCDTERIRRMLTVTVNQSAPKESLSKKYENSPAIVDMESYFMAEFCRQMNLAFLSFRAVSDGLRDEIDFDPAAISDARGQVKILLVLASVLRNPRLVGSYFGCWRRSTKAARSLGKALRSLVNLSPAELLSLGSSKRSAVLRSTNPARPAGLS